MKSYSKKVRDLPKKIKIARNGKKEELLTFFRKGYIKKFYTSDSDKSEEINFDDAISMVECNKSDKAVTLKSNYYDLLKKNKNYFDDFENQEDEEFASVVKTKGSSHAKKIEAILKEVLKHKDTLSEEEIDKCNKTIILLQDAEIPFKLLKNGNKLSEQIKSPSDLIPFYKDFVKTIPETYYEYADNKNEKDDVQKEIVLSELFVK